MWLRLVGGGMKRAPSWRRSDRCGLKMSLSRAASSAPKAEASSSFDQKAPPTTSCSLSSRTELPQCPHCSEAAERLNLSKLRSTPWGTPMLRPAATRGTPRPAREAAMDIVALRGAESRANCRAGPTERPVREVAISVEAGLPKTARPATTEVATRLGAESLKRSMPKSTPPYRPCIFGAESVLRAPSFKLIFEKQRSFHN
mmetsp:Transcript_141765/g.453284  ORF Transcript_141765/g.453284 Transcript_141765/m.453284 type:complete len:201 (+) Transcript_141765:1000-1602(+)